MLNNVLGLVHTTIPNSQSGIPMCLFPTSNWFSERLGKNDWFFPIIPTPGWKLWDFDWVIAAVSRLPNREFPLGIVVWTNPKKSDYKELNRLSVFACTFVEITSEITMLTKQGNHTNIVTVTVRNHYIYSVCLMGFQSLQVPSFDPICEKSHHSIHHQKSIINICSVNLISETNATTAIIIMMKLCFFLKTRTNSISFLCECLQIPGAHTFSVQNHVELLNNTWFVLPTNRFIF